MDDKINREDLLFYIAKEDVQYAALEKLGRHLTDEELDITKKGLEGGLMTGIDVVYKTIFFEMIDENENGR